MIGLKPVIEVAIDGKPVSSVFYNLLVSATITDVFGNPEADSFEARFDDEGNRIEEPRIGAVVSVRMGYADLQLYKSGTFIVDKPPQIEGGDGGEFLTVTARGADMRADLKEPLSEHFDDPTVDKVFGELAKRHGLGLEISPSLKSLPLGDGKYLLRNGQSVHDFCTRIGDRIGAVYTYKDNKMLLVARGTGSVSGSALPAIRKHKSECSNWTFTPDPRPQYGKVGTRWFDRKKGLYVPETAETGLEGPEWRLRHPYASKDEAERAAKSEGERLSSETAVGSVTFDGDPEAAAGADLILSGFRASMSKTWLANEVRHEFAETYLSTVDFKVKKGGGT
ncbi:hypothetical protein GGD81_001395 [Rhodobium orientis]|nr:contractile injection system protein, VgrG/Pvc8 family [Rhodobium orientis]MBB4302368.1 hypothetical protein [Rhodobium orientis]